MFSSLISTKTVLTFRFCSLSIAAARRRNVSNKNYICTSCGALRRTPIVSVNTRKQSLEQAEEEAKASSKWPKHCEQAMRLMTDVQAQGATQLPQKERVKWLRSGMYVQRQRQRGKHKWKPVTAAWHVEEAIGQKAAYFVRLDELTRLQHRGKLVKIGKNHQIALGAREK